MIVLRAFGWGVVLFVLAVGCLTLGAAFGALG